MDAELNIFTKTKTSWVHTWFSLPYSLHQISALLPFTCMTEWYGDYNSARVSWTKAGICKHFIQRRRQGNMGSLLDQQ